VVRRARELGGGKAHVALRGEARDLGKLGGKADALGEAPLRLKGSIHRAGGGVVIQSRLTIKRTMY
jgi:hypothetical protein